MLVKDIKIPIYDCVVKFYLETNLDSLKKQLKEISAPFSDKEWEALTTCNDSTGTIGVYITTPRFLSDLHHECIHAANFILGRAGVLVSAQEDEALAYLSTFIFKEGLKVKEEFDTLGKLAKKPKPVSKPKPKPKTKKHA